MEGRLSGWRQHLHVQPRQGPSEIQHQKQGLKGKVYSFHCVWQKQPEALNIFGVWDSVF